jgi:hypothetical protein
MSGRRREEPEAPKTGSRPEIHWKRNWKPLRKKLEARKILRKEAFSLNQELF